MPSGLLPLLPEFPVGRQIEKKINICRHGNIPYLIIADMEYGSKSLLHTHLAKLEFYL